LTRRGRRGLTAQQRRYLNRVVSRDAYRDVRKAESINVHTRRELEAALVERFGVVVTPEILKYARGEVVSDAYGRGSLQMYDEEEEHHEHYRGKR